MDKAVKKRIKEIGYKGCRNCATKSNHFECVSGQNVAEMEYYILYAQSGKGEPMILIDGDALIADCQLAQKQADRNGREFANAFYSGGGDISTEWWCVEDMIENAPTIEERKTGKWLMKPDPYDFFDEIPVCSECGHTTKMREKYNFCPNCGADMRGEGDEETL